MMFDKRTPRSQLLDLQYIVDPVKSSSYGLSQRKVYGSGEQILTVWYQLTSNLMCPYVSLGI